MDDIYLVDSLESILDRADMDAGAVNEGLDFSQLEKYISDSIDAGTRQLPDSPPDSGSEPPFSPQDQLHLLSPHEVDGLDQRCDMAGEHQSYLTGQRGYLTDQYTPSPLSQTLQPWSLQSPPQTGMVGMVPMESPLYHITPTVQYPTTAPPPSHKTKYRQDRHTETCRKRSLSPSSARLTSAVKREPKPVVEVAAPARDDGAQSTVASSDVSGISEDDYHHFDMTLCSDGSSLMEPVPQSIYFTQFQKEKWHQMCDANLKELQVPYFKIDADKGFNYSTSDEAFVCQKKNHFQVTCHVHQPFGRPHLVKTAVGLKRVDSVRVNFFGVKTESLNQTIKVEQSQSDRTKRCYRPVPVDLTSEQTVKITVGRLHFSETTINNMRKKGKPNPDQRFFFLVVSLEAVAESEAFPLVQLATERIIVRASNPGQFEPDSEQCWQRGVLSDSTYHVGRVGINTDKPEEALVIHGNVKLTGHLYNPSDRRIKSNINEMDTKQQLDNVQRLRVVSYDYDEQFANSAGLLEVRDTGMIAQEVQTVLPDAVKPAGDIILPNGKLIDNLLVVNKERIFMENVGAVKELCKVTDTLENRIQGLERVNRRITKLKRQESILSTSSVSTVASLTSSFLSHIRNRRLTSNSGLFSNKWLQSGIMTLILVMITCLITMTSLYVLESRRQHSLLRNGTHVSVGYNSSKLPSSSGHLGAGELGSLNDSRWTDSDQITATADPRLHHTLSGERRESVLEAISAQRASETSQELADMPSVDQLPRRSDEPFYSTSSEPTTTAIGHMSLSEFLRSDRNHTNSTDRPDARMPAGRDSGYVHPDVSSYAFGSGAGQARWKLQSIGAEEHCRPGSVHSCQVHCCGTQSRFDKQRINELLFHFNRDTNSPNYNPETKRHVQTNQISFYQPAGDKSFSRRSEEDRRAARQPGNPRLLLNTSGDAGWFPGSWGHQTATSTDAVVVPATASTAAAGKPATLQRRATDRLPLPGSEYIERLSIVEYPNIELDARYCDRTVDQAALCVRGRGGNVTLRIPVSRHMPHQQLHLQIQYRERGSLLSEPVSCRGQLQPTAPRSCSDPDGGRQQLDSSQRLQQPVLSPGHDAKPRYTLPLPVGQWHINTFSLRVALTQHDNTSPCSIPRMYVKSHFLEFNFIFERQCET